MTDRIAISFLILDCIDQRPPPFLPPPAFSSLIPSLRVFFFFFLLCFPTPFPPSSTCSHLPTSSTPPVSPSHTLRLYHTHAHSRTRMQPHAHTRGLTIQ